MNTQLVEASMKIVPELIATRFEQLTPGDLFIFLIREEFYIALAAREKSEGGRNLVLILGPKFPEGTRGPTLFPWAAAAVVSFGKEYQLRLPTDPHCWSPVPPNPEQHCVLLVDNTPYFRADFVHYPGRFHTCYVRASDGMVEYEIPRGIVAFALEWEISTIGSDSNPRSILKL
jgi:hypothetical protein